MQIRFIGHSHHRVTQSSRFFTEVLERLGAVEYSWDETWRGREVGDARALVAGADLVVVWQSVAYIKRIATLRHPNVVYVPMFDASRRLRRSFWQSLYDTKILNFSSTLHQRVQRFGTRSSAYFQYFPNPEDYPAVCDFSSRRGFFWQRHPRPNWEDVKQLIGPTPFESMHLHLAADPNCPPPAAPPEPECRAWNIEVTHWFRERADLLEKLQTRNIYFAPRLDEGIGLSFLEAMAMGMVVCAHDSPTHNEYIVDGINGRLYELGSLTPPNWKDAEVIGQRARLSIEKGASRWRSDRARLLEFLAEPVGTVHSRCYAMSPSTTRLSVPQAEVSGITVTTGSRREGGRRLAEAGAAGSRPVVTIATVVRNAAADLPFTLDSVTGQNYPDKEVIVIDGASDDETLSVVQSYGDRIDYWHSAPDGGPYDAMNKAAETARGRWIIYINAGDQFVDPDALARFVAHVPDDADFVAGHHVYLSPDGVEEIHRCAHFERTYRRLLAGDTGADWLAGIPGHQAVLTRVDLIRQYRYDVSYKIAADHEFMYRMRRQGASFHIEPVIVSQYVGGGRSWQNLFACLEEWRTIALRYTEHEEKVEAHFRNLLIDTLRFLRRTNAFDWRREPVRSHVWLTARVELEFRLRSLLDRLDALYARWIAPWFHPLP